MKKHILFLFAAALALVGCSNEDLVGEQPAVGQQVTLKASVEVGGVTSRVAADDLTKTNVTFHWETGDKVILANPNNPTEQQELSIVESSINGTSACFTGNALSNMKNYMVVYGKGLTSTAVTKMLGANPKLSLTNATDNLNYLFTNKKSDGTNTGNGEGFTLYPSTHIRLQLKGDGITLGKVEYYTKNPLTDGYYLTTTVTCGTNGLALNKTTATDFILPANMASTKGFKLVFTAKTASNEEFTMEKTSNFDLTEKVGKMVNFGELEVKKGDPNLLPGLFTVKVAEGTNPAKKVQFTKSNLYWNGSEFKFEANQTDYDHGTTSGETTTYTSNHVSHFYWTKDASKSYALSYSDGTETCNDVPFFAESKGGLTVEGTPGLFALSGDEWQCLIDGRTNAADLRKKGQTVGGKANCMLIAPDNFDTTKWHSSNSYTLDEVNALGLVCLPAAGQRKNSSSLYDGGSRVFYWSSDPTTYYEDCAFFLCTYQDYIYVSGEERGVGMSLRLVVLPQ